MKKIFSIAFGVFLFGMFVGCSTSQIGESANKDQIITSQSEQISLDSISDEENTNESVVVYFSATGNTEIIAKNVSEALKAPIYRIEPLIEYTDEDLNYNDNNCRANIEQNDDSSRPEIANDLSDILKFDKIYLGYAIWWGTNPKIIQTFLETYDLSGKTMYVFSTSGGSGVETSINNLQSLYSDINIVSGKRFESTAGTDEISNWIYELN